MGVVYFGPSHRTRGCVYIDAGLVCIPMYEASICMPPYEVSICPSTCTRLICITTGGSKHGQVGSEGRA